MEKSDAIAAAKALAIKSNSVAAYACCYQTTGWTFLQNQPMSHRPLEVLEVLHNGTVQLA